MRVTVAVTPVNFIGTREPNSEDQMRVTGYFAHVYFMGTRGPNQSERIFCSCIFHGDQRTK
jgi:hypothetical protein